MPLIQDILTTVEKAEVSAFWKDLFILLDRLDDLIDYRRTFKVNDAVMLCNNEFLRTTSSSH